MDADPVRLDEQLAEIDRTALPHGAVLDRATILLRAPTPAHLLGYSCAASKPRAVAGGMPRIGSRTTPAPDVVSHNDYRV